MTTRRRLLAVLGSGEITPTMVTPHQRLLASLGPDPDAVVLDTPYGFQENADELSARIVEYFAKSVGVTVTVETLRSVDAAGPAALAGVSARVADADWVFAGPGSPSYLLRQWRRTDLPAVLRERLRSGGAVVFASAAAVTLGRLAVPVYEIYKVGEPPHWIAGLDLLSAVGLDAVVIPHYDNAEGGTHDTRYCYLGARRLRRLEEELDPRTWILGVDEHTAAVLDLDEGEVTVVGRGSVTVRHRGRERSLPAGTTLPLAELPPAELPPATVGPSARDGGPAATGTPPGAPDSTAAAVGLEQAFRTAVATGDAARVTDVVLELEEWAARTDGAERGEVRAALRRTIARLGALAEAGLQDPREAIAPHVETLLHLRDDLRAGGRYDEADHIRQHLHDDGVEIRDTPDGTRWDVDRH